MYKAFSQPVRQIALFKTGELVNKKLIINELKSDVRLITDLTEWHLNNDKTLLNDLELLLARHDLGAIRNHNAKMAQALNIKLPEWVKEGRKSGNSRLEHIYQHKVISEAKSWLERRKAKNKKTKKWVSKGWSRTADDIAPNNLMPKISTSAGAVQYAQVINNPFIDGEIHLKLVIKGVWYVLIFNIPKRYKKAKKITLPDISIDSNDELRFNFTAQFDELPIAYSSKYIIGVDVGITEYATISVIDVKTRLPVYSCGVSRFAKSLINSIEATRKQIKHLSVNSVEKQDQRFALSRKRRELAIQVAQEIVELSQVFDNALVVFEDLSHMKNTMKHGRWNRGELVKWVDGLLEIHGSKSYSVNAAYTSQDCSKCGLRGSFKNYSVFVCSGCGFVENRDVNASMNIALRFLGKVNKENKSTFDKVKSFQVKKVGSKNPRNKKSLVRGGSRNVGHVSARKNKPTPKQVKKRFKAVKTLNNCAVMENTLHTVIMDEPHYGGQDSKKATIIRLIEHKFAQYQEK